MSEPMKRRGMGGKDVITVGIFSAIYFVINFAFMLLGGLHLQTATFRGQQGRISRPVKAILIGRL